MTESAAFPLLGILPNQDTRRAKQDRLELLTALIAAPNFDALFASDVIALPPQHPVFAWQCEVDRCERVEIGGGLCTGHSAQWTVARQNKVRRADFALSAAPVVKLVDVDAGSCRICPDRPAHRRSTQLCAMHHSRWHTHIRSRVDADLEEWTNRQMMLPSYGPCRVTTCPHLSEGPLRLCIAHRGRYRRAKCPGNAHLPVNWKQNLEAKGLHVPILFDDEATFHHWCHTEDLVSPDGTVALRGLQPLVKAEIQWGMFAHTQQANPTRWSPSALQHMIACCLEGKVASLFDLPQVGRMHTPQLANHTDARVRMIVGEIVAGLWCVYYSPADTREAGFIETDHFGRRFAETRSHYDLTRISQRWLRDLLWDHLAEVMQSARCPRRRGALDNFRRAGIELSAFLESDTEQNGNDPRLLDEATAQRFAADQRHRARNGLSSLGLCRSDGQPSKGTETTRRIVFNNLRAIMLKALESGRSEQVGLQASFVAALPWGGPDEKRSRSPFSDEVARALADESNLRRFTDEGDPNDRGVRDIWEAIVYTGRRCSEILQLRLDCISRLRGLPLLWHDQTKVGNYNEAIRIPEILFVRLDERRKTTLSRFEDRYGRMPSPVERKTMALFPTKVTAPDQSMSYGGFNYRFKRWVDSLDLGPNVVAHQARHTMATNLMRAGASLTHIRRYLGQVSDRMAEHYTKVSNTDLEDVLQSVWVAGPGSAVPGQLLSSSTAPLSREEAMALVLDLSRRSTPTAGGFCTFQPVVNGGACPWKLDCENCDKFVVSGADLLYWRRKQEQWRSIAERAPDDATADYLHQVFEPTARAIKGLEQALGGLGLLEEALALDLRRPQDYFHRLWSTNFLASDLATVIPHEQPSRGTELLG